MPIIFLLFGFLGIFIVITSLVYFISPRLSPIPFFPTNKKDLSLISQILLETNGNLIIDLGAGTGTIIFPVATTAYRQQLKTRFIAVEIHPLLVLIMYLKRCLHPNKNNIAIIRADILKMDYQRFINNKPARNASQVSKSSACVAGGSKFFNLTIYLYVGHMIIEPLKQKLNRLPKGTRLVSYMYNIPGWEQKLVKKKKNIHAVYLYRL